MSLKPIPTKMLHDSAVFRVVTGMDRYQNKLYETHLVAHVHLQEDTDVIKGPQDTEVQLRGCLFVDSRKSQPVLDYNALQAQSLANGAEMRVTVYDASGAEVGDYPVLVVDGVPDVPATRVHHWELGLGAGGGGWQ